MKQLRLYRGSDTPPPKPPPDEGERGGGGKFPSPEEIQPVEKPKIDKPDEENNGA
jgi:hypothetical protein